MNIRKINPSDESLFNEWLSKDELHKANGINWSLVVEPGTDAYVGQQSRPTVVGNQI